MTGFNPQGPQSGGNPNDPSGQYQPPQPWGQPGDAGQHSQPDPWSDPADDPWSKQDSQWTQPQSNEWVQQAPTQQFQAPLGGQGFGAPPVPPSNFGGSGGSGSGNNKMWLLIGGGALIVILIVAIAAVAFSGGKKKDTAGGGKDVPVTAKKASDAVRGYLTALAANDATSALKYGDTPGETAFLTNDSLKSAHDKAPMSAVNVPEVAGDYFATVNATYTLGTQQVSTDFRATKTGDTWKLDNTFVNVDLSDERHDGLKLLLNGGEVKTDSVNLFPGSYVVTSDNTNLSYGTENTLLIKGSDDYVSTSKLDLVLSTAGTAAVKAAAKKAIDTCVASKLAAPTGCPWKVLPADGTTFVPNSLTWKLTNNPLADAKFSLDYDDPTTAKASVDVDLRVDGKGIDSGKQIPEYKNNYEYVKISVDLKQATLVAILAE
jgi:hypothetical protein